MTSDAGSAKILALLAEGTAAATGDECFRSLAKHAALALGARYAFVAESLSELESRSLAYWEGSDFGQGFSYRFPGTPCERVAQGHVCSTRTRLKELFPEDLWLLQIGVDSYVGVPMKTADGRVLGHMAVLDAEPIARPLRWKTRGSFARPNKRRSSMTIEMRSSSWRTSLPS